MVDKTREKNLWYSMKNGLKPLIQAGELEINRVENRARNSMPDVEGHLGQEGCGQFWIELKTAHRPKRASTPIRTKFQDGQSQWGNNRWAIGGNAYLLIQVGKAAQRKLYLIEGCNMALVEEGLPEQSLFGLSVMISEQPSFIDIVTEAARLR